MVGDSCLHSDPRVFITAQSQSSRSPTEPLVRYPAKMSIANTDLRRVARCREAATRTPHHRDGSDRALVDLVKSQLRHPDSFVQVETTPHHRLKPMNISLLNSPKIFG